MEHSKHSPETTPGNVSPYPLTEEGENIYSLISDHSIQYAIWFKDGPLPGNLEEEGYDVVEFSFLPEKGKKLKPDDRIGITIAKVLRDYFDDPQNVIVYICDEERGRGAYRQKLFKDWYELMGTGYELYQFQPKVKTHLGETQFYAGVILRSDCPKMQEVISLIEDAAPDTIREKYLES